MIRALLLLCLACCTALPAQAQADGRGGAGVPTLTLYMKTFGALEQELSAAQASGDTATLDRLLGPFFELRRPRQETEAREALMAGSRARRGRAAATLSDLSVYEVGAEAVAYFLLREADGQTRSVVDVWTRAGGPAGPWQLRLRFEQPL
ncbi:nuclear transport factor 2 family protein [Pelomonas sp. KK5]|uniref:nuclear transport factor 2 family protein n=1 Tax=Pelomonas sp. KK5 TaxID=1855730 RepID=UPI00097BAAE6|nr:nuclear transport factor 2 family protein [Pelomonas sp. KK5]